jgi:hypothetical protein
MIVLNRLRLLRMIPETDGVYLTFASTDDGLTPEELLTINGPSATLQIRLTSDAAATYALGAVYQFETTISPVTP